MEREPVRSSCLRSVGYDEATRQLVLEFVTGRLYAFEGVPASVHAWLMRVPNKGVFIAQHVTPKYAYQELKRFESRPQSLEEMLERSLAKARELRAQTSV